jgi:uncharacterized DUF497 family protein
MVNNSTNINKTNNEILNSDGQQNKQGTSKQRWSAISPISKNQRVRVMVFNTIFNTISVISSLSVLLEEKTGVPRENH